MNFDNRVCDFSFSSVGSIQFGLGAKRLLAKGVDALNSRKPLLITDQQLIELGLVEETLSTFADTDITVEIFDSVTPDPLDTQVVAAVELALSKGCDSIIGFGGGSPMDVAKLTSVLAHPSAQSLQLSDMYGVDQFRSGRLPLIQVPTTAGTGSEVTAVSIVTTGNSTKSGIVNSILYADRVILDPELTLGLPAHTTATTGIDAMVHALEAYTSRRLKNPMSDALAIQALGLMSTSIENAVRNGQDVEARGRMLYGSMLAGQAFANAPVGGVHALAYPLGGLFHVSHGLSNSLVLPHVLNFNSDSADDLYSQVASTILGETITQGGGGLLAEYFNRLAKGFGIPTRLRDVGVKLGDVERLAEQAMLQGRLLVNNPVSIEMSDAINIYADAY